MTEIRNRKSKTKRQDESKKKPSSASSKPSSNQSSEFNVMMVVSLMVGTVVMAGMGYIHAQYMARIHENWMWFSNIKVR